MNRKYVYVIILIALLTTAMFFVNSKDVTDLPYEILIGEYQKISPENAIELIGMEGVFLIDVRTVQEYNSGHIPESINLPLDRLDEIADLVDNKDSVVIVYCRSGNRSKTAANQLINNGYTRVLDLGGIASWPYETTK